MSYTLDLQELETGELFVAFPDEFLEEVGWQEGDILEWDIKGNGITLNKLNHSNGFEIDEE